MDGSMEEKKECLPACLLAILFDLVGTDRAQQLVGVAADIHRRAYTPHWGLKVRKNDDDRWTVVVRPELC